MSNYKEIKRLMTLVGKEYKTKLTKTKKSFNNFDFSSVDEKKSEEIVGSYLDVKENLDDWIWRIEEAKRLLIMIDDM